MDSADLFAASWTVPVGIAEVVPRRCVQTDGQISAHFLLRTCWIQLEAVHASGMTPVKEALLPCVSDASGQTAVTAPIGADLAFMEVPHMTSFRIS